MFVVANETIEIVALPKSSSASKQCVNLPGSKTLPTQENFFQRPHCVLHEYGVHVVWHHDPRELCDPFAVKMT
jgi:hypothetical protein